MHLAAIVLCMEFKEQYPQLFINDEEKITTTAVVTIKKILTIKDNTLQHV